MHGRIVLEASWFRFFVRIIRKRIFQVLIRVRRWMSLSKQDNKLLIFDFFHRMFKKLTSESSRDTSGWSGFELTDGRDRRDRCLLPPLLVVE